MRKSFVALFVLLGAAVYLANNAMAAEFSDVNPVELGQKLGNAQLHKDLTSRAHRLGSSAANTDTISVGYWPGHQNLTNNYWSVMAVNNKDGGGHGANQVGQWGWEPPYIDGDSLQGWWPNRQIYNSFVGTRADWARPWGCGDEGNTANYRINGASGRTYGVLGVWHRDDAGPAVAYVDPASGAHVFDNAAAAQPQWSVLQGSYSAWMGVRAYNDVRFSDPITGQPFAAQLFDQSTISSADGDGSDSSWPGYGSQMDQILYRDIDMSANLGSNLTLGFMYQLAMSTGIGNAAATRCGWFEHDPLQQTDDGTSQNVAVGNFISSTDAGDDFAPRDSFMVYVGAPVGSSFLASDGNNYSVYDPQRRWFDEVLRSTEGLYHHVFADTGFGAGTESITITNDNLAPILSASGGKVRVAFRVKTNRGFDDQGTAFTSGGMGAAQIDAITYAISGGASSPAGWGTFEDGADPIDNSLAVDPLDAWKSTGKPPWNSGPHVHDVLTLPYDDLCGQVGSATRICDLAGVVISFGDHDHSEAAGGLNSGTYDREVFWNLISPTIQLAASPGVPNAQGLTAEGADATEEYYIDYDLYAGIFNRSVTGNWWRFGVESYPSKDDNGNTCWGNQRQAPYIIFNPDPQCFQDFVDNPLKQLGMIKTSNASGLPDSVRITIGKYQACYRVNVSAGCSPTDGCYFDNVDLMLVDGTPQALTVSIWDWYNDTFPANETAGYPGSAAKFDTTSAIIKTGLNVAQSIGTGRFAVPGDSVYVSSSSLTDEVHMVFRILPGPGNYVNVGRPDISPALRKFPNSAVAGVLTDKTDFWQSYMNNGDLGNGPHGTSGGHTGGVWNPNVWNSARMDTTEVAVFAFQGKGILGGPADPANFMSSYHEDDARGDFEHLGIKRPVCFLTTDVSSTNDVTCQAGFFPAYIAGGNPAAVDVATGWPGVTAGGVGGTGAGDKKHMIADGSGGVATTEGTKILPDGVFAPGTHIEYFIARYPMGAAAHTAANAMIPDTSTVFPQTAEGSTDAKRWQEFSVLPDMWKNTNYKHPVLNTFGPGLACMLVVDNNDRRGNERVWVAIADTIGATSAAKHGAHNGWYGAGGVSPNDPAGFVAVHIGHPGTTWDMYQTKASESIATPAGSMGGRLAVRDPANTQVFGQPADYPGKSSRQGPTPEMLDTYYRLIFWMSGDLNSGILGPFLNRSNNEVKLIEDWLAAGNPDVGAPDRAFWAMGDGFGEDAIAAGSGTPQEDLMFNYLGIDVRDPDYKTLSGNAEPVPDLTTTAVVGASTYGVRNVCLWTNDVFDQTPGLLAETSVESNYEAFGLGSPYISGIAKNYTATHPWYSLLDGYDIEHLTSQTDYSTGGRHLYFFNVLTNLFGSVCTGYGTPIGPLEVPNSGNGRLFNFVNLRNNPLSFGQARVHFGLAKTDRVEVKVFDVSGRLVRTLADRTFQAGEHDLLWDGTDDGGRQVSRGVYFTQVKYKNSNFTAAKKLTVLK